MKIYKVSPILKYSPFFALTYVSKEEFGIGDLVPIDFNNRKIRAVVLQAYNLKDAKVEIRKADFQTKKIETRFAKKEEKLLSKKELQMLLNFSHQFLIPVGELIYFIYGETSPLPSPGEGSGEVVYYPDDLSLKTENKPGAVKGETIFTKILNQKISTLTIKDFNFDKYLNFQAPHISKLDLLFAFIESRVSQGLDVPGKIILETDFLGVVETNWVNKHVKGGKLFRKIKVEVYEQRKKAKKFLVKSDRDENGEEMVLAKEVLEKIVKTEKNFFFVLSHGFADRIFCNDCKKSYECEKCGFGYSLLSEEGGRSLFCKHCKNKKALKEDQYVICKHCGSWRVFPFGVGVQRVKDFLNPPTGSGENFPRPGRGIVAVDESQKKLSVKKINEIVKEFLDLKSGHHILIGSVRTLNVIRNLNRAVNRTFVVSTGPVVRGKYFDSDEKFVRLLSELENISQEVYINKHAGDEVALENYKDKDKFIQEEIVIRNSLGLPPETKVLSLIFDYRNKKQVDKFLMQNLEDFKQVGEIKKGHNYIYYWFLPSPGEGSEGEIFKYLRQFGDLVVANSIVEQTILGKK